MQRTLLMVVLAAFGALSAAATVQHGYVGIFAHQFQNLAGLQVPVSVLAAADDPVIPADGFPGLQLPAHSHLEMADFGGHCGFLEGAHLRGFAERWVASRLEAAAGAAGRATMPASLSA